MYGKPFHRRKKKEFWIFEEDKKSCLYEQKNFDFLCLREEKFVKPASLEKRNLEKVCYGSKKKYKFEMKNL